MFSSFRFFHFGRVTTKSPPPSLFGSSSFRKTGNRCLLLAPPPHPRPPSRPHAPLPSPSQIQARCQRENKQNSEEEKQRGVDGFTASLIKGLFTSEGEEPAGCQAAGGRGWVRGPLGDVIGCQRGTKASRWCDLFIPVVSFSSRSRAAAQRLEARQRLSEEYKALTKSRRGPSMILSKD